MSEFTVFFSIPNFSAGKLFSEKLLKLHLFTFIAFSLTYLRNYAFVYIFSKKANKIEIHQTFTSWQCCLKLKKTISMFKAASHS